jgi:rhodanese-related sulfurtransferase
VKRAFGLVIILSLFFSLVLNNQAAAADEVEVKHVNPEKAKQLISEKKIVVVDVRTPAEFRSGHIEGATNIDYRADDFSKRIQSLDKDKSYLVHCASGGRSTQALPVFKKFEFKSIYHLDGGINAWRKENLPLSK